MIRVVASSKPWERALATFAVFAWLVSQPASSTILSYYISASHQPPATSQSAVLFSHNKSAPAISHSQANTAKICCSCQC